MRISIYLLLMCSMGLINIVFADDGFSSLSNIDEIDQYLNADEPSAAIGDLYSQDLSSEATVDADETNIKVSEDNLESVYKEDKKENKLDQELNHKIANRPQRCFVDEASLALQQQRFNICGSGDSILDTRTGLLWARCSYGKKWNSQTQHCEGDAGIYNWQEALNVVVEENKQQSLANNNDKDWRLPNIKELASIVNTQCIYPAIDSKAFPDTNSAQFWTSSVFEQFPARAWYVGFALGHDYASHKRYYKQLRLVRAGTGASSYNAENDRFSELKDSCRSEPNIDFLPKVDVALRSEIISDQAALAFSGGQKYRTMRIINGQYQVNNQPWNSVVTQVKSGDIIKVRHLSSAQNLSDVLTTLYIDNHKAIFKSTTTAAIAKFEEQELKVKVLFAYDSFDLTQEAKTRIREYVEQYRTRFDQIANIIIIGHTDNIGSQSYNLNLSSQRAKSVAEFIQNIEGIPDQDIEYIGRGKLEPITSNDTIEDRAENRRVVMRLEFK